MQNLTGDKIFLRALEPEDLNFLYDIENDSSFWEVSGTQTPYSRHVLTQYLANAHQDIYEARQLRLVIAERETGKKTGLIDLYDFNPQHQRAGIGILVIEAARKKGFASEALDLLIGYSFKTLGLHQLYASISSENQQSLDLFAKHLFERAGLRKDWSNFENKFKDVYFLQRINK